MCYPDVLRAEGLHALPGDGAGGSWEQPCTTAFWCPKDTHSPGVQKGEENRIYKTLLKKKTSLGRSMRILLPLWTPGAMFPLVSTVTENVSSLFIRWEW